MKIIIDGHGGHCCTAYLDGTEYYATGYSIADAISALIQQYPEKFGIDKIEILPCSTTAYTRSGIDSNGSPLKPEDSFVLSKEAKLNIISKSFTKE